MIVTIATNIVIKAWLNGEQLYIRVLSLVGALPHLKYGLDHDGRINKEYRQRCSNNEFFEKWHKEIWEKVVFINGRLEKAMPKPWQVVVVTSLAITSLLQWHTMLIGTS